MTHRDDLYYQAAQDDWRGCCARPEEALLLLTLDLGGRASCTPAMDLNCASNKHEILSNVEPNTNSFQTPVGYSYSGTLDGSIKKKRTKRQRSCVALTSSGFISSLSGACCSSHRQAQGLLELKPTPNTGQI